MAHTPNILLIHTAYEEEVVAHRIGNTMEHTLALVSAMRCLSSSILSARRSVAHQAHVALTQSSLDIDKTLVPEKELL